MSGFAARGTSCALDRCSSGPQWQAPLPGCFHRLQKDASASPAPGLRFGSAEWCPRCLWNKHPARVRLVAPLFRGKERLPMTPVTDDALLLRLESPSADQLLRRLLTNESIQQSTEVELRDRILDVDNTAESAAADSSDPREPWPVSGRSSHEPATDHATSSPDIHAQQCWRSSGRAWAWCVKLSM